MSRELTRLSDLAADARYALRAARRRPGLSVTLICTLALGLGLGAAVFSFADGYLFRPLPFPSAEQLYRVRDPHAKIALLEADADALRQSDVGHFGFVEWSAGQRIRGSEIIADGRPVRIWTFDVSPGFGQTVRLPLAAGRMFEAIDHQDGGGPVPAWMGHAFWRREFGGDPGVLNRSFRVTGEPATEITIVGILTREVSSFDLNNAPPDVVVPALVDTAPKVVNRNRLSFPIVRLPGIMSRAEGEARISAALQGAAPAEDGRPRAIVLRPLRDAQVAGGQPTARVLLAGALLVLLLVSINLATLLLAQGVARGSEIATRAALGASRWRIARLFLVESLLLGVAGIGGGLLLGVWLSWIIEARIPRYPTTGRNLALVPMAFDERVVLAAVILGLGITVLGSLWPAWRASRRPLHLAMRGSSGIESRLPMRLLRVVLVSELGVATVLLLGAVFIGHGIWKYLHRPLGFSYADRVVASVDLARAGGVSAADPQKWAAVRDAIAAIPGVRAVGAYQLRDGQPIAIGAQTLLNAQGYEVSDGYFEAWEVRLVAGRLFSVDEIRTEAPVTIVDAAFARRAWPDADAIGQDLRVGTGPVRRVIGVVETQVRSLTQDMRGEAYLPRARTTGWPRLVVWAPGIPAEQLVNRLAPAIATTIPVAVVRAEPVTLAWLFNRQTGEAEFQGPIMIAFGVLTFVLAGIGVFGLVSYLVAQRTREFGIRLSLGARRRDIWIAVVREALVPAVAGLVAGCAAAWALERFVRASVFGWPSSGVVALIVVSAALLIVALIAAAGSARRTLRIDPAVVLRGE